MVAKFCHEICLNNLCVQTGFLLCKVCLFVVLLDAAYLFILFFESRNIIE